MAYMSSDRRYITSTDYGGGYGKKTRTFKTNKPKEVTPKKTTEELTQDAMDEYQAAYDKSKADNELRYGNIIKGYDDLYAQQLAGYGKRYDEALATLEGAGDQSKLDIAKRWKDKTSASMQDLVDSGMYNSTIKDTVRSGEAEGVSTDVGRLNESLRQQKLGLITSLSADTLNAQNQLKQNKFGVMERRTDSYPDQGIYMQMMENLGYGSSSGSSSGASSYSGYGSGKVIKTAEHKETLNPSIKLEPAKGYVAPKPWDSGAYDTQEQIIPSKQGYGYNPVGSAESAKKKKRTAQSGNSTGTAYFGSSWYR